MNTICGQLKELEACDEGLKFGCSKNAENAWKYCKRIDWLIWSVTRDTTKQYNNPRTLLSVICDVLKTVLDKKHHKFINVCNKSIKLPIEKNKQALSDLNIDYISYNNKKLYSLLYTLKLCCKNLIKYNYDVYYSIHTIGRFLHNYLEAENLLKSHPALCKVFKERVNTPFWYDVEE